MDIDARCSMGIAACAIGGGTAMATAADARASSSDGHAITAAGARSVDGLCGDGELDELTVDLLELASSGAFEGVGGDAVEVSQSAG